MSPFRLPPLTDIERNKLEKLYRTTQLPRLRTRAQIVFLAADHHLKVPERATIVGESEPTVLRWLKRYHAEGITSVPNERPDSIQFN